MNIVSEIISSYMESFYQEPDEDLVELRSFAEEQFVPIIQKDTEELLRILTALQKPARILEIGTAIGYSACFFARTCGASVTTIEKDEELYWTACSNIRQLNCSDKVFVIHGDAKDVLQEMNKSSFGAASDGFDFVFIDAAKSHYREFWDLCVPLCADDAMIVCDNVLMRGLTAIEPMEAEHKHRTSIRNMREFLQFVREIPYADTCVLTVGDGVSLSRIDREIYDIWREQEESRSVSAQNAEDAAGHISTEAPATSSAQAAERTAAQASDIEITSDLTGPQTIKQ